MGMIPKRWQFLLNEDIKISSLCCNVMKKTPFKIYEKKSKKVPYIGVMAVESNFRKHFYLKNGCNSFNTKRPMSMPLNF